MNKLFALFALFSVSTMANTTSTVDEINHLMSFVKETSCIYERNGKRHTGEEALGHIKKKYDYFLDDIKTSEDFIKYAATKSKMSGKYYLVHCDTKPSVKSKDWLLAELQKFRGSK